MSSVTESPWNKLICSTIIFKERWLTQKIAGFKSHNSVYIVVINSRLLSPSLLFSGCCFPSHVVIALLKTPTANNNNKEQFSESLGSWGLLIAIWLKRLSLLKPIYNTRNFSLKTWTFKNPSQLPWALSFISGWVSVGQVSINTQCRIFFFIFLIFKWKSKTAWKTVSASPQNDIILYPRYSMLWYAFWSRW